MDMQGRLTQRFEENRPVGWPTACSAHRARRRTLHRKRGRVRTSPRWNSDLI